MISQETIDKVYQTARIEEVVGDYVKLRKRGANYTGLCPFHEERTPSFSVSPSKGIYKCFGCGKAGNVVNFVMEHESRTYPEAIRMLAERYHIPIVETRSGDEEDAEYDQLRKDREAMLQANAFAAQWFQQQMWETDAGQSIGLSYFYSRQLTEEMIRKFGLGYSPNSNALSQALREAGYAEQYLLNDPETRIGTGLLGKTEKGIYDRFRDRVIFPMHNVAGKVVAFAGRILVKKEKTGKYVNSPESIIYTKGKELYGLYFAKDTIRKADFCYLVEGQLDLISMHQAGVANVVCSGGTALTDGQISLLKRYTENVCIIYDGDAAGIHAALRGTDMFLEAGMNVKVLLLPDGEDPDSFSHKMTADDFQAYLKQHQQDFLHFKVDLLGRENEDDPKAKIDALRSIIESIACIRDKMKRQVYEQSCAKRMGVPEDLLKEKVNQLIYEKLNDQKRVENYPQIQSVKKPTIITAQEKLQQRYTICQKDLLRTLLRYGERRLGDCIVGQYILQELEADGIILDADPVYVLIINEYQAHVQDDTFVPSRYFSQHENPQIAAFASSLLFEKYTLSRIYSGTQKGEVVEHNLTDRELETLVTQQLLDLRLALVRIYIHNLNEQIKAAGNDMEQLSALLSQIQQYQEAERQIKEYLGAV